jgi:hypothetical protein
MGLITAVPRPYPAPITHLSWALSRLYHGPYRFRFTALPGTLRAPNAGLITVISPRYHAPMTHLLWALPRP